MAPPFEIYPVLDLRDGVVVHARGGERSRYAPVESALAASARPLDVARAFRSRLGLERLYVADLEALGGAPPSAALGELAADGFRLLADAGVRDAADARRLLSLGVAEVIAPLETLPGPGALSEIIAAVGAGRLVFSLDLRDGRPLGRAGAWPETALAIAHEAHRRGARRLLILDVARVGSRSGPAHLDLLRELAGGLSGIELLAGGGVRSAADLDLLRRAGARAALVASAFHDGSLTRESLAIFGPEGRPAKLPINSD
jgi:phosphoribosylformimino-5-aminoimidazole carboxamide ribotide isomerase